MNDVMGLALSSSDILELERRTSGWIAGLQMAVLSIVGRDDISDFIKDFAGSNRFGFDYLIEEVLASQTPKVTQFLLKTSILNHISIPLCDAILGIEISSDIIGYLAQIHMQVMVIR